VNLLTATYHQLDAWWWPYLFILIAGWLANDMWRMLGVVLAGRLSDDSAVFTYVKSVATALVAGVIAQLVFLPSGSLGLAPMWLRLLSVAAGFAAYKASRDNVLVAVLAGEAVLLGLWAGLVGMP
jgi:branched-subunit amino acid transport protein